MKRPLFPVMIGLSLAFHGAALLLPPGLRGGSSFLSKAAEIPVFSLVNIEVPVPVTAAPDPPPPVTAAAPDPSPPRPAPVPAAPPAPAAERPAAVEAPPTGAVLPVREDPFSSDPPAETAAPAAARNAAPEAPSKAAPGSPPAAARRALIAAYTRRNFDYIQRRIREKLVYPAQARRTGAQGRAEAVFTVYPDGSAGGVEILTSSGQGSLDQALVDAIRAAAPFPPPPAQVRLVMPLTFRLK
jgi:protein TonB